MECIDKLNLTQYMDISAKNLEAFEELLVAIQISETDEIVLVEGEAVVDLAQYDLTQKEIEKFSKIFRKINALLAESFQKKFPTSSVISEIRSKSHPSKNIFERKSSTS